MGKPAGNRSKVLTGKVAANSEGNQSNGGYLKWKNSYIGLAMGLVVAIMTQASILKKGIAEMLDWRMVFKTNPELVFSIPRGGPEGVEVFVENKGGRPASIVEVSLSAHSTQAEAGSRVLTTWVLSLDGQSTIISPGEARLLRAVPMQGRAILPTLPPPGSEDLSKRILRTENCSLQIIYGDTQVGNQRTSKPFYCYAG